MMSYFIYGDKETEYLKSKDKKLAGVIEKIGHIDRLCYDDLFEAVVNSIIGQQISTKAHQSVWKKIKDDTGKLDANTIISMGREKLQGYGTTWRKVDYIMEFATKVQYGECNLEKIKEMTDEEVITALSSLKGVGTWTAEMILIFCLQRQNVFSYGDLAILRGVRMVYHHRKIDRKLFEKYRRRFSPYCSVASLYFWAVAGGAIPEMKDYAVQKGGQ